MKPKEALDNKRYMRGHLLYFLIALGCGLVMAAFMSCVAFIEPLARAFENFVGIIPSDQPIPLDLRIVRIIITSLFIITGVFGLFEISKALEDIEIGAMINENQ